jgi:hypothetical protein
MKTRKLFFLGLTFISQSIFSQSVSPPEDQPEANKPGDPQLQAIIFRYDDAGNQIYRGTDVVIAEPSIKKTQVSSVKTEDSFWLGIQIYPVPVKDVLTISWNEESNDLIESVSIYQHTTMAFLFKQKNYANLNRQVQIDMSSTYMGVYVLSFQLTDGRVMTRNIIKE